MALQPSQLKRQRRYMKKIKDQHICLKCRNHNPKSTVFCPSCSRKRTKSSPSRSPPCKTINQRHLTVISPLDPNSLFFNPRIIEKIIGVKCTF